MLSLLHVGARDQYVGCMPGLKSPRFCVRELRGVGVDFEHQAALLVGQGGRQSRGATWLDGEPANWPGAVPGLLRPTGLATRTGSRLAGIGSDVANLRACMTYST